MIHDNIQNKKILTQEIKQNLLRVVNEYRLLGYNKLSVHYTGERNNREFDISLFNEINNEINNIKMKVIKEEEKVDHILIEKEIKILINSIKYLIESLHPNFYTYDGGGGYFTINYSLDSDFKQYDFCFKNFTNKISIYNGDYEGYSIFEKSNLKELFDLLYKIKKGNKILKKYTKFIINNEELYFYEDKNNEHFNVDILEGNSILIKKLREHCEESATYPDINIDDSELVKNSFFVTVYVDLQRIQDSYCIPYRLTEEKVLLENIKKVMFL